MESFQIGSICEDQLRFLEDGRSGQHEIGFSISDDGLQPRQVAIELREMRWVSRNGYDTGVQATEKPFDEVESWRVKQQCSRAFHACELKRGRDCASAPLQFPISQMKLAGFAVKQEGVGKLVGMLQRTMVQQLNQS